MKVPESRAAAGTRLSTLESSKPAHGLNDCLALETGGRLEEICHREAREAEHCQAHYAGRRSGGKQPREGEQQGSTQRGWDHGRSERFAPRAREGDAQDAECVGHEHSPADRRAEQGTKSDSRQTEWDDEGHRGAEIDERSSRGGQSEAAWMSCALEDRCQRPERRVEGDGRAEDGREVAVAGVLGSRPYRQDRSAEDRRDECQWEAERQREASAREVEDALTFGIAGGVERRRYRQQYPDELSGTDLSEASEPSR